MKKLLSFILAGTMVLSLSAPAFAAEAETTHKATANQASNNNASIDVKGTYLSELKSDEIISVVVAWEDMNFIYYGSQEGTWQPSDHTYSGEKTATWNKTTSNITVTNHSNTAVTANLSYTQSVSSVTGKLSDESLNLESAAQDDYMGENAEKAPTKQSTFTIGGSMDEDSGNALGTITVSVDKTEEEKVTYELTTEGTTIAYWNFKGEEKKGDPDWSKVRFVVKGSDGSTKTLEYNEVTVTQNFEGDMDLSMKPSSEEKISRKYSFTAVASADKTGTSELSCTFSVVVSNNNFFLPSTGGDNVIFI